MTLFEKLLDTDSKSQNPSHMIPVCFLLIVCHDYFGGVKGILISFLSQKKASNKPPTHFHKKLHPN